MKVLICTIRYLQIKDKHRFVSHHSIHFNCQARTIYFSPPNENLNPNQNFYFRYLREDKKPK